MSAVSICDVGPRDGLQNEAVTLDPAARAELVRRLVESGLGRVEAVSFVHPARVPPMAGAEQVLAELAPDVFERASGLVVNGKGLERALASGLREIHYAFAATETLNRRNANASVDGAVDTARTVARAARAAGVRASVTIGASFGCPYEGVVDERHILALTARIAEGEPAEIMLADTIGVATPGQVARLVRSAQALFPVVGVHLHNTRGTGIANAWTALEAGASSLDASVGGTGGCPFAPNATGNIATEDLVYMLESEGIDTGIDLDRLIDVAVWLGSLLGREPAGQVARAGAFPR